MMHMFTYMHKHTCMHTNLEMKHNDSSCEHTQHILEPRGDTAGGESCSGDRCWPRGVSLGRERDTRSSSLGGGERLSRVAAFVTFIGASTSGSPRTGMHTHRHAAVHTKLKVTVSILPSVNDFPYIFPKHCLSDS